MAGLAAFPVSPATGGRRNLSTLRGVASPPLVDLRDVAYRRSGTPILRDLRLALRPGEALGVSGPNGAGKTTLLRLLASLIKPSAGRYDILGLTGHSDPDRTAAVRRRIALIGHIPALWPELTLRENLEMTHRLRDASPLPSRPDPLRAVGLADAARRRAGDCSEGMQRRAELARLLTWTPDLLLLDEPHAGLDPAAAPLVDLAVGRTVRAGGAAVLVSHDVRRVSPLLTRSVRLRDGTLAEPPAGTG